MKTKNFNIKWYYPTRSPGVTVCDIKDSQNNLIAYSFVGCYYKDNFCKDTGRKLSLARAMANANLKKEERKVIWEAYRNMTKKKRW